MSPVDFKKWQCPLSLFLDLAVNFDIVQCHLSVLRNGNFPVINFLNVPVDCKGVQCRLSILRNGRVALPNLRVKGPR